MLDFEVVRAEGSLGCDVADRCFLARSWGACHNGDEAALGNLGADLPILAFRAREHCKRHVWE